jgi:ankyrin repeat protein
MLLDAGADKSIKDKDGKTAAVYATENGHSDCLKLLI